MDPATEVVSQPATPLAPEPGAIVAIAKAKARLRRQKKLAKKIDSFLKAKEEGRRMYAMADRLLDEISSELKPGREIQLYDTQGEPWQKYQLVDLFADKKIVWKPCGVRRYDLVLAK